MVSMKNFNATIGNRTRDLPACSTVPQPTAPPSATPEWCSSTHKISREINRAPEKEKEKLVIMATHDS